MSESPGFPLFLVLWNRLQGQGTPGVHLRIANWLWLRWQCGDRRLLLMAFRSCGKSSIVGLFAAFLLWQNPQTRILVLAADAALAGRMVRNTRRIIERHPMTRHLRPGRPDQWASDRFTVDRPAEGRDPSMAAFGIGANITGSRADIIICDDVEVPNTCDTAEKREILRERLRELGFVLVPGGTQLYVGTPHTFQTIYATEESATPDAEMPFLEGYKDLRVPLLDAAGCSAWPERFRPSDIENLRRSGGPRRFAAQMLLQAQPLTDTRLNVDALHWYEDAVVYNESGRMAALQIGSRRMTSVTAWWDPAFGRGGDGSVVAIVYADGLGDYWLQHLEYLKISDADTTDEATQQCRSVASLCRSLHVTSITLEINGIGRFLPAVLRRELAGAASVHEFSNRRPKDVRIAESFDAILAARALHVHRQVAKTPFLEEMRNWRPGSGHRHDDGLDAVAGAISLHPVRMPHGARENRPRSWQGFEPHKANSNFNILE